MVNHWLSLSCIRRRGLDVWTHCKSRPIKVLAARFAPFNSHVSTPCWCRGQPYFNLPCYRKKSFGMLPSNASGSLLVSINPLESRAQYPSLSSFPDGFKSRQRKCGLPYCAVHRWPMCSYNSASVFGMVSLASYCTPRNRTIADSRRSPSVASPLRVFHYYREKSCVVAMFIFITDRIMVLC